jgi:putative pyruvate formate lyase activating enzyme
MVTDSYPGYRSLLSAGKLDQRIRSAYRMLGACNMCPRSCSIDRTSGERGYCRGGMLARVSSFGPHFGEESPLVGRYGSGTIFLAGCNLGCCFCQNFDISHHDEGREVSGEDMAVMMLRLADGGCHNINFVTPTHFVPQIMEAIALAAEKGLSVPIVYNCGGYESIETLRLLDGVVDTYMPDFKFSGSASARRYLNAADYPEVCKTAIREMHRQVGDLILKDGVAVRGLLVRHLVMPGHLEDCEDVLRFLAKEISPQTFVNVMDQYRPCYHAAEFPEISRRLRDDEFKSALMLAKEAGLERVYY